MPDYFWYNPSGSANWTGTGGAGRWYPNSGGVGTKYTTVPGPTDNAIFDAASGAGVCNFPNAAVGNCLNLYCNGYGAVGPTTTQISGGPNSVLNVYGDIQLSPNQVFDLKQTPAVVMTGTANGSINCNGNTFGDLNVSKTAPASVTLNDDLIGVGNATLNLVTGTLNANNKNVTFGNFYTGGTATRTLTMGSGTWTLTFEGELGGISFNTWQVATTTGLTFNKDTATIRLLHAKNDPSTNNSQTSGLRTALTSGATTIDLVDITPFNVTSGLVLIGNEVIAYSGVNTGTRQLTGLTRGYGGTTTLASVPAGTAVLGVLLGNSTLTANMTSGVSAPISVVDASLFPPSGVVYIGTEQIAYAGTNLTTNQLGVTTVGTPTQNHSISDPIYSYQAKNFYGGGLTYNDVVFGCFGYKVRNYIYGTNTFSNIKNSQTGFTWSANSNYYPGFQELAIEASKTNTISTTLSFNGTSSYLQQVYSQTAGTQTTLSIVPAVGQWNVGTHSQDGGNNTNIYFVAGAIDYIYWKDIIGLPVGTPPITSTGNFFLVF